MHLTCPNAARAWPVCVCVCVCVCGVAVANDTSGCKVCVCVWCSGSK